MKQLSCVPVSVFQVLPLIVDTGLDKGARKQRGQKNMGISPQQVVDETLTRLKNDVMEIPVGMAKALRAGSRLFPSFLFRMMNKKIRH